VISGAMAPMFHRYMTNRFPQLAGTRITHAWTGNVAFTFDEVPAPRPARVIEAAFSGIWEYRARRS
jgi:glycine/D-amino acid oxidase-like deaminating enzyme